MLNTEITKIDLEKQIKRKIAYDLSLKLSKSEHMERAHLLKKRTKPIPSRAYESLDEISTLENDKLIEIIQELKTECAVKEQIMTDTINTFTKVQESLDEVLGTRFDTMCSVTEHANEMSDICVYDLIHNHKDHCDSDAEDTDSDNSDTEDIEDIDMSSR